MGSTQRYFIDDELIIDEIYQMSADQSYQLIHVMRASLFEKIICITPSAQIFYCEIIAFDQRVRVRVIEAVEENNELDIDIILIYGLPKLEKFEMVIQKATELGVRTIIPCLTKRSIVKLDQKKIVKKHLRWQEIIKQAAEQSHREQLPTLYQTMRLTDLTMIKADYLLVAYEDAKTVNHLKKTLKALKSGQSLALMIGPEGGFDPAEIDYLEQIGYQRCGLGQRILRTETAAIFALSAVVYQYELN